MRVRTGLLAVAAFALVALLFAAGADALPVVIVENGNNAGAGSLRQAIMDVDPGGTIVIPAAAGTISLTSELVDEKSVTIEGSGSGQAVISAGGNSRVLRIAGTPTVTLDNLQIINGQINEPGQERFGGGIDLTGGSLTVVDSLVAVDSVLTGTNGFARGGGIAALKGATSLTLRNTVVSDCIVVGQGAKGAGIYVDGPSLTIEGGSVKGNRIEGQGAEGGGVLFRGTQAVLSHVAVTGNEIRPLAMASFIDGAGLLLQGTGDSLDGVTVAKNHVTFNDGTAEGVHLRGGGAALGGPGTSVVNSTFNENSLVVGVKQSVEAIGGGIWAYGTTDIASSTIAANTAQASAVSNVTELGADLGVETNGSVTIRDTIVAAGSNISSATCGANGAGTITSVGHNIDSEDACGFNATGDRVNVEPLLDPLADNGGPVTTMALQPGSPALGGASPAGCPSTDARGVLRPAGNGCDIGAFELATPIASTGGASAVTSAGAVLAGTATNPDLRAGTVTFELGTGTAYGSKLAAQPIAATTRAAGFSGTATGLAPATTYHYRVVVTNPAGTAFGADRTFTTAPAAAGGGGKGGSQAAHPKLTVKHLGGLRFKLGCAQALCRGRLLATARSGKKHPTVAKAKLRIAAGKAKTVTLKLTRTGKRLAAEPGELPIVVKARLGGDGPKVPKPLHLRLR
jgi:hypothetical protein